jgi:isochorismate pyruvate lyase
MSNVIPPDLVQLRREIDAVDSELVQVLARRQKLVEQVVTVKQRDSLPAFMPARVDEVLDNVSRQAAGAGLSPVLARTLWKAMIDWFIVLEEAHLKKGSPRAD